MVKTPVATPQITNILICPYIYPLLPLPAVHGKRHHRCLDQFPVFTVVSEDPFSVGKKHVVRAVAGDRPYLQVVCIFILKMSEIQAALLPLSRYGGEEHEKQGDSVQLHEAYADKQFYGLITRTI